MLPGLFRVRQAEVEGMLGGQEWDDMIARDVVSEVGDQVAQIVFLLRTDRAVGEEHAHRAACQIAHGVVRVDPRVHPFARSKLCARWTEFRRNDGTL
jgi:hypothetical protein